MEDDIDVLLRVAAEKMGTADPGTHRMFRLLIQTTLQYRDQLHAQGVPLTVQETREALDTFMEVLKTHTIPKNLDPHVHELLVMWLEEVRKTIHH